MAMQSQKRLILLHEGFDRLASYSMSSLNGVEASSIGRRMHDIDGFLQVCWAREALEILFNGSSLFQIDMRINRSQLIVLFGQSNIGRVFLGRPRGLSVIHLFVGLRPEGCGWHKGITEQFIPAWKPVTVLGEVNHVFQGVSEETWVAKVPVSRNEKDQVSERFFNQCLEEREQKLINESFLVGNHILISLAGSKRREKVTAEDENLCRRPLTQIEEFVIETSFTVKIGSEEDLHAIPQTPR